MIPPLHGRNLKWLRERSARCGLIGGRAFFQACGYPRHLAHRVGLKQCLDECPYDWQLYPVTGYYQYPGKTRLQDCYVFIIEREHMLLILKKAAFIALSLASTVAETKTRKPGRRAGEIGSVYDVLTAPGNFGSGGPP
ncbi:hypothetical protein EVAR_10459_1 [Eumeta japonica]|uniref:Uncharacterized protein n=1 Tax=Eumeta variegata TaxID=151549 RepID=A0A4C1TKI3_EUMVA|nr:hypothetical protein EVAR_10459_1 [Eumeta japonica]